jgi:hypothetical protein
MPINWNTVQTAAATAGVVTLLVEYVAKPRMEARKERILAAHRSRRELLDLIADLTQSAGVIGTEIPTGADRKLQDKIRDERRRQLERLETKAIDLFDNVNTRYSASYVGPIRDQVVAYASCVYGILLSPMSQRRKAELITSLGEAMIGILAPNWWRPTRHSEARTKLSALIADAETPPDDKRNTAALEPDTR